ncbi:MAG: hypothetical protein ABIP51_02850 [Bacteroidia bacterium]
MKKIIYLPIIALIILCSCKDNSFMTQRYTKFGHSANENALTKKHQNKTESLIVESTEIQTPEYPQTASASETSPILFVKVNLINPIKENFQRTTTTIIKKETKEVENSKTEFKNKSTISKNKSTAHHITGTLLKIVLWVVILAVVVGVLLIIGALA